MFRITSSLSSALQSLEKANALQSEIKKKENYSKQEKVGAPTSTVGRVTAASRLSETLPEPKDEDDIEKYRSEMESCTRRIAEKLNIIDNISLRYDSEQSNQKESNQLKFIKDQIYRAEVALPIEYHTRNLHFRKINREIIEVDERIDFNAKNWKRSLNDLGLKPKIPKGMTRQDVREDELEYAREDNATALLSMEFSKDQIIAVDNSKLKCRQFITNSFNCIKRSMEIEKAHIVNEIRQLSKEIHEKESEATMLKSQLESVESTLKDQTNQVVKIKEVVENRFKTTIAQLNEHISHQDQNLLEIKESIASSQNYRLKLNIMLEEIRLKRGKADPFVRKRAENLVKGLIKTLDDKHLLIQEERENSIRENYQSYLNSLKEQSEIDRKLALLKDRETVLREEFLQTNERIAKERTLFKERAQALKAKDESMSNTLNRLEDTVAQYAREERRKVYQEQKQRNLRRTSTDGGASDTGNEAMTNEEFIRALEEKYNLTEAPGSTSHRKTRILGIEKGPTGKPDGDIPLMEQENLESSNSDTDEEKEESHVRLLLGRKLLSSQAGKKKAVTPLCDNRTENSLEISLNEESRKRMVSQPALLQKLSLSVVGDPSALATSNQNFAESFVSSQSGFEILAQRAVISELRDFENSKAEDQKRKADEEKEIIENFQFKLTPLNINIETEEDDSDKDIIESDSSKISAEKRFPVPGSKFSIHNGYYSSKQVSLRNQVAIAPKIPHESDARNVNPKESDSAEIVFRPIRSHLCSATYVKLLQEFTRKKSRKDGRRDSAIARRNSDGLRNSFDLKRQSIGNPFLPSSNINTINSYSYRTGSNPSKKLSYAIINHMNLQFNIQESISICYHSLSILNSISCIEQAIFRQISDELESMQRILELSNYLVDESLSLTYRLHKICMELISHVFQFAPKQLLIANKRNKYATVLECLFGLLGIVLECTMSFWDPLLTTERFRLDVSWIEVLSKQVVETILSYGRTAPKSDKKKKSRETEKVESHSPELGGDENFDFEIINEDLAADDLLDPTVLVQKLYECIGNNIFTQISHLNNQVNEAIDLLIEERNALKGLFLSQYQILQILRKEVVQLFPGELTSADEEKEKTFEDIIREGLEVGKTNKFVLTILRKRKIPFPIVKNSPTSRHVQSFEFPHYHALSMIQFLLFSMFRLEECSVSAFSETLHQLKQQNQSFHTIKSTYVDAVPVIPIRSMIDDLILKLKFPQILPAMVAIELFHCVIEEDIKRRQFLERIANGEDQTVADLQFLNVTIPLSNELEMMKASREASSYASSSPLALPELSKLLVIEPFFQRNSPENSWQSLFSKSRGDGRISDTQKLPESEVKAEERESQPPVPLDFFLQVRKKEIIGMESRSTEQLALALSANSTLNQKLASLSVEERKRKIIHLNWLREMRHYIEVMCRKIYEMIWISADVKNSEAKKTNEQLNSYLSSTIPLPEQLIYRILQYLQQLYYTISTVSTPQYLLQHPADNNQAIKDMEKDYIKIITELTSLQRKMQMIVQDKITLPMRKRLEYLQSKYVSSLQEHDSLRSQIHEMKQKLHDLQLKNKELNQSITAIKQEKESSVFHRSKSITIHAYPNEIQKIILDFILKENIDKLQKLKEKEQYYSDRLKKYQEDYDSLMMHSSGLTAAHESFYKFIDENNQAFTEKSELQETNFADHHTISQSTSDVPLPSFRQSEGVAPPEVKASSSRISSFILSRRNKSEIPSSISETFQDSIAFSEDSGGLEDEFQSNIEHYQQQRMLTIQSFSNEYNTPANVALGKLLAPFLPRHDIETIMKKNSVEHEDSNEKELENIKGRISSFAVVGSHMQHKNLDGEPLSFLIKHHSLLSRFGQTDKDIEDLHEQNLKVTKQKNFTKFTKRLEKIVERTKFELYLKGLESYRLAQQSHFKVVPPKLFGFSKRIDEGLKEQRLKRDTIRQKAAKYIRADDGKAELSPPDRQFLVYLGGKYFSSYQYVSDNKDLLKPAPLDSSNLNETMKVVKLTAKSNTYNTNSRHYLQALNRKIPYRYSDVISDDHYEFFTPLNLRKLLNLQEKILNDVTKPQQELRTSESTPGETRPDNVLFERTEAVEPVETKSNGIVLNESSIDVDQEEVDTLPQTPKVTMIEIKSKRASFPIMLMPLPNQVYIPRKTKYRSREASKIVEEKHDESDLKSSLETIEEDEQERKRKEVEEITKKAAILQEKQIAEELEEEKILFPSLFAYELTLDKEIQQLIQNQKIMRKKMKETLNLTQLHEKAYGKNKHLSKSMANKLHFPQEKIKVLKTKRKGEWYGNLPFVPSAVADELWKMQALQWLMSDSHHNNEQHEHEDVMRDLFELALFYVPEEETFRNFHYYMNNINQVGDNLVDKSDIFQDVTEKGGCSHEIGDGNSNNQSTKGRKSPHDDLQEKDQSLSRESPRNAIVYSLNPNQRANSPQAPSSIKMDIIDNTITRHLQLNRNRASIIRKIHSTIVAKHSVDNYMKNSQYMQEMGKNVISESPDEVVQSFGEISSNPKDLTSRFDAPNSLNRRGSGAKFNNEIQSVAPLSHSSEFSSGKNTELYNAKSLEDKIDQYMNTHTIDQTRSTVGGNRNLGGRHLKGRNITERTKTKTDVERSTSSSVFSDLLNPHNLRESKISSFISKQIGDEQKMNDPIAGFRATSPQTPKSSFTSPRRKIYK